MAGLPPLLGFLGKELIYEAKVQSPGIASLVLVLGVISNVFMVAVSQILVETLTVVMFMAILQRLPRFAVLSSRRTKFRDFFIALGFGGVMTVLALKAVNVNLNPSISDFYLENSYTKAFGENVVNVILVDFRALDTVGELTVLTIAAVGVFLLLSSKSRKL